MTYPPPSWTMDDIKVLEIIARAGAWRPSTPKGWEAVCQLLLNRDICEATPCLNHYTLTARGIETVDMMFGPYRSEPERPNSVDMCHGTEARGTGAETQTEAHGTVPGDESQQSLNK